MRLKIHESTIKMIAKMMNGQKVIAIDDLGNRLDVIKRGHFVIIEVGEGMFW